MTDEKVNSDQNMNSKQGVSLISSLPTTQVPVSILTNKERRKSIHDESNFERSDSHEDQSKSNSNRRNIYKNDYSTNLRDFSFANLKQNSEKNKDGHEIQINTSMPANTNGQQKSFSPSLPSAVSFTVPEVERLPYHRYSISNKPGKQQQQQQEQLQQNQQQEEQQKTQLQEQNQRAKQQEEVKQIQEQVQKKQTERQQLIDEKERITNAIFRENTTNDGTDIRKLSVSSGTSNSEDEVDSPSMEKNSIVHMPGDFIYFNPKSNASKTITAKAAPLSANSSTHKNKEVITAPTGPRVPFTEFFQKEDDKKFHILIGATGSVATIKVPLIIDKLFKIYGPEKISIQLIVTKPAEHFLKGLKMSTHVKIWREEDAWVFDAVNKNDTSLSLNLILHHELRKWADIFLIAPLSANTLAKLANGICNNLLTSVMRDWSPLTPVLIAPAMNTFMYINPMTKKHLTSLVQDYPFIQVLKPVEKVLICGDIGMGGMREWTDIVEIVRRRINEIRKARDEETGDKEQEQEEQEGADNEDDDDEDDEEDEEDEEEEEALNETASDESNDEEDEDDEEDVKTEV
ncbi:BAH_G0031920.mRNA.1.CDS.1 [Saccharomyces cerevisiae]|nr:SX2_G0003960.mRNA.1.CDS.1 [Saccharomyces cerevisiae]CAI4561254.1 BAH_G0031920.mRNA.1.CDS.1 [Saccharomyces cerevisiae]CAI4565557.1 BAG_1a_G0032000.mRNA.1.CDS.1 [Saccharomyces cerevisiae]CAI7179815.1 BAG_1a_G0032000.mRNA.1.CDS.1 [Saccharomyces cerevisiae]CAI7181128.1 BAH_G0031920.mRNA.1.CDS.1 [Saccharomyces cerevisiae]